VGSFWFVGLVVLPHITRLPIMSYLLIDLVHFELESTTPKAFQIKIGNELRKVEISEAGKIIVTTTK
jgi:hypothetical protein